MFLNEEEEPAATAEDGTTRTNEFLSHSFLRKLARAGAAAEFCTLNTNVTNKTRVRVSLRQLLLGVASENKNNPSTTYLRKMVGLFFLPVCGCVGGWG